LPDSSLAGQEHGRTIPLTDISASEQNQTLLKRGSAAAEH